MATIQKRGAGVKGKGELSSALLWFHKVLQPNEGIRNTQLQETVLQNVLQTLSKVPTALIKLLLTGMFFVTVEFHLCSLNSQIRVFLRGL